MSTTQTGRYKIKSPSQNLVERAIREVPETPYKAEVKLRVNGIGDRLSESEYLERCRKIGVIPKSRLDFELDQDSGLFLPGVNHSYPAVPVYFLHNSESREKALEIIVGGGKFAEVGFSFADMSILRHFGEIREKAVRTFNQLRSQVSAFTDGGYDITGFELAFSGDKSRARRYYVGLFFSKATSRDEVDELGLEIGSEAEDADYSTKLERFFESLKE